MHNTAHQHPPPYLAFTWNLGTLCGGCTLSGYLIGFRIRFETSFNEANPGTTPCDNSRAWCPTTVVTTGCDGSATCTVTWTCTPLGGLGFSCTPSSFVLPWSCNDFRYCTGNACTCTYLAALNNDGSLASTPDPSIVGSIQFGCSGLLQGFPTRWLCDKYSLTQGDFFVSVPVSDVAILNPSCSGCADTCPQCNPCSTVGVGTIGCLGTGGAAACDALHGYNNWEDCRPNICDPAVSDCDGMFGACNWRPGSGTPLYTAQMDCVANAASVAGCNPCPYCDPEADDCTETGDLGTEDVLAATKGRPCRPCAFNKPIVYGNAHGLKHCPGTDNCGHYPSCPDCATFDDCNPAFSATLYGHCGSSFTVSAP